MPTPFELEQQQYRLEAIEQAEGMIDSDGECYGDWNCDQCHLIDYMEHPDDCSMDSAYQAACDLLDDLGEFKGRCVSIWR